MNHVRNISINLIKSKSNTKISNVMKKIVNIILILVLLSISGGFSFAAKATPTPTVPTLQQQVDELKTKIASKVASLNLVERRGIYGIVTDASDTQITLKNENGENRFIDVDELTKFTSSDSTSFGISDVKKGMWISVLGLYNKDSQRLQARIIYKDTALPNFYYGAVYSIDSKNFTFILAKENGAKNLIDVESITKSYSFTGTDLTKAGFTKITLGETAIIIGYPDKANKNMTLGSRIILFPEISASSKIDLNTNEPTVIPSTGSGLKLTPIK